MAHQSAHRSATTTPNSVSTFDHMQMSDALAHDAHARHAANDAELLKQGQVNPLWMITAALAMLVVLALLSML